MNIVNELKHGKRHAIARAISIIENNEEEARSLIKKIFKNSGNQLSSE